jgi:hypothetical protein
MKRSLTTGAVFAAAASAAFADPAASGDRSLTIYNQNFAVVRQVVPLDLKAGVNHVTCNDITYHVEPSSVVLRDPTGKRQLRVLEQNYRADPISEGLLLAQYEGKTIDFLVQHGDHTETVQGKIIRSGYVPHTDGLLSGNYSYYQQQQMIASGGAGQPIVEVDGKLQFSLPGTPQFPGIPDDSILKPTLDWQLEADQAGSVQSELSYVTSGLTWSADYNLVSHDDSDKVDLVGWVTLDNESGKTFDDARIKLMAGDVNKINSDNSLRMDFAAKSVGGFGGGAPVVTEKAFDEYHLYTLQNRTTLRDRETKQVEFVRALNVPSQTLYVYDGAKIDDQYRGWSYDSIRTQASYGTQSNKKVWVMKRIANTEANHLGIPLPKGKLRFYRQDTDGQLEFTGEDTIDHTPKDEMLQMYVGNAFDIAGERRQTNFTVNANDSTESFEIKVRNHKTAPVDVHVVEHLYRWNQWEITKTSAAYQKKDAQTIEYLVHLAPNEERTITYTAHYTW